ncbi:MAG: DUF1003 domain-containing protein [Bacteroidetes bacterium]|nr:DUF1003 domain-containing protein [Bacteroidota bacterium]
MSKQHRYCQICKKDSMHVELIPAAIIRPAVSDYIATQYPEWSNEGYICRKDLKQFRYRYLYSLIEEERGAVTNLEEEVISKMNEYESLSENVDKEFNMNLTFGQKLSDKIATFGGSWRFIIIFGVIIFVWMLVNSYFLLTRPFDPYPFILLNLVLSCLAALQAPIIMMSQNRQEARDRKRSENDYKINLKSELEIRQLHQKIDHLLTQQWERMVQIQELQIEMIEKISEKKT